MAIRKKETIETDIRLRSGPCPESMKKISNAMLKGLQTELEYAEEIERLKSSIGFSNRHNAKLSKDWAELSIENEKLKQDDWISVESSLPKINDEILTYKDEIYVARYLGNDEWKIHGLEFHWHTDKIDYWKHTSIPEPKKENR